MNTRWDRIEPNNTTADLQVGLSAAIADPLWMLGRQWQLGELRGEDAASLVKARLTISVGPVATFRNDAAGGVAERLSRERPLETRVEAERVVDGPATLRLSADAGLQLARRLEPGVAARLRARFPLKLDGIDLVMLPPRQQRELSLLAARAIDGLAVASSADPLEQAGVPPPQRHAARDALRRWREELRHRVREPEGAATWSDTHLEYQFSVGAKTPAGEVVLSSRHAGGHLDWYSFDVAPDETHGLAAGGTTETIDAVPTPLQYRGMPASRYWELEEGSVYFGDLAAGPADLARLLVAEFATVYGDDWSVIPIRVRSGSLVRVDKMTAIDSFGDTHEIGATAVTDGPQRVWTMFELARDASADGGKSPWLFVPTVVATSLVGRPVEKVTLVRDEAANLAWGVEESYEGPTGRPVRRRLISQQAMPAPPLPGEIWSYRLSAPVPPHWVPFVPEPVDPGGMILRRGRMQAWDQFDASIVGARGRFLLPDPAGPLRVREEALPRGGLELTRAWQLARGSDGELHLWMSREKRPGRGERGSGLEMDQVVS